MSCSSNDKDNGGGAENVMIDTVILTYDRARDHLDVTGKFNSLDLALDMLSRARRALESQLRIQQHQAVQRAAADQAIAQRIMRKQ